MELNNEIYALANGSPYVHTLSVFLPLTREEILHSFVCNAMLMIKEDMWNV